MRKKILVPGVLAVFPFLFAGCSLTDSGSALLNTASVKFSEGSPPVDGQDVSYSGSLFGTPSLDKFALTLVFHVKADNSRNTGRASFGSDAVKPVLNFRIDSRQSDPIAAPIPAFSVPAGVVQDLQFPVAIPLTLIDKAVIRKIIAGDPIPYFLTGTIQFQLFEGTALKGSGESDIDLASGEISTRPSGSVVSLLSGLL